MKRILVTLFVLFPILTSAQERMDSLYFKDGSVEGVKILTNYDDHIEFQYPGETMVNNFSKAKFEKIVFSSGRQEICGAENKAKEPIVDYSKFEKLRWQSRIGNINLLRGTEHVRLEIVFAKGVAKMIDEDIEDVKQMFFSRFIESSFSRDTYKYETDDSVECEVNARLVIASADADDGEVYGYVEYFNKDNEEIYSFYIDGENDFGGGSFAAKIIQSASSAGKYSRYYIYRNKKDKWNY